MKLIIQKGTTNPGKRDKQIRDPVFMVAKDFVSKVTVRTGTAHNGGTLRPHELKGASGIIPQVKINYVEVGLFCNQSKETSRQACEQIFRSLSDRVRAGENVAYEIPLVGRFLTKSNIAAIAFNPDLIEQTRGQTAKNFNVGNIFASSNNVLNMNIHTSNAIAKNSRFHNGGAMVLTDDANSWLKNNLDINVEQLNETPYKPLSHS